MAGGKITTLCQSGVSLEEEGMTRKSDAWMVIFVLRLLSQCRSTQSVQPIQGTDHCLRSGELAPDCRTYEYRLGKRFARRMRRKRMRIEIFSRK